MTANAIQSRQAAFRGQALNRCVGAAVFTVMGSLWALFGIWSLGQKRAPALVVMMILAALLLAAIVKTVRRVRRLPQDSLSPESLERIKRTKRAFGLVNSIQGIAIGATFVVGSALHRSEYILPVVALIVGLHFFALVPILRMKFDYIIGALLCLLALVTMLVLPIYISGVGTGAEPIFLWGVVIGLGNGIVLWLGAISRLFNVRAALSP